MSEDKGRRTEPMHSDPPTIVEQTYRDEDGRPHLTEAMDRPPEALSVLEAFSKGR